MVHYFKCVFLFMLLMLPLQIMAAVNSYPMQRVNKAIALANVSQPAFCDTGFIEGGVFHDVLTAGYPDWAGAYLKGVLTTSPQDTWLGEFDHAREFGQEGNYATLENLHTINDLWYTSTSVGFSDRTNFWPKTLVGATLYKKWCPDKNFVTYLGAHGYWWRTSHTTQDINPGLIYYFKTPWVVEAGSYLSRSNPGVVLSASGYVAVTEGREKQHYLTLRYGFGREAYQALDANNVLVGYPSQVVTLTWRQWVSKNWGFNLVGEGYHNPNYNRYGGQIGIFRDF